MGCQSECTSPVPQTGAAVVGSHRSFGFWGWASLPSIVERVSVLRQSSALASSAGFCGLPFPTALPSIGADVRYLLEIKNSGGVMERQKAQEGGLVVGDRRAELTCSGGFGANTGCIVIGEGQGGKRETERARLTPNPQEGRRESSNEERVKDSRGGLASSFTRQTQGRRAARQPPYLHFQSGPLTAGATLQGGRAAARRPGKGRGVPQEEKRPAGGAGLLPGQQ